MKRFLILFAIIGILSSASAYSQFANVVVSLTGNIFDRQTKAPIDARILAKDENGTVAGRAKSNASTGNYFLTGLNPNKKYTIEIASNGYFNQSFTIEIPNSDKYAEYSRDYLVSAKTKGMKLPVAVLPFDVNKSKIRGGADIAFDEIVDLLNANKSIRFTIYSYPDANKDISINQKLTEERANAVKEYLASQGIAPLRISVKSNSDIDPERPIPSGKQAKGKKYKSSLFLVLDQI